ncbi:MAG: CoA-transferase [Dehalococcoidia bacterium]
MTQRPQPAGTLLESGEATAELTSQGALERIRCARAGIAALHRWWRGTPLADGKEIREFNGANAGDALHADFAIIRAHKADRYGNLVYRGAPTFNATMAGAARVTIAEVDEIVPLGGLRPEHIVTPGVYVQRVVQRPAVRAASWREPR